MQDLIRGNQTGTDEHRNQHRLDWLGYPLALSLWLVSWRAVGLGAAAEALPGDGPPVPCMELGAA